MATKRVIFKGKSEWCKPWQFQLDSEFAEPGDGRGGNFATNVFLDDESVALFNELGVKAKLKDGNKLTVRRYEEHPVLGPLGPVAVTGVDELVDIGNGSDVEVSVDVYDYTYKGRPSRALRWVGIDVLNLVEYVRPDTTAKLAVGVPVF